MNQPPEIDQAHAHRIVRTPPDKPFTAICTSRYPIGCRTHFANHRTVPCEGEQACEACAAGHAYRWHGYVGALHIVSMEHVIFEYTAPVAKTFAAYIEQHHNVHGCHFQASRPGGRPNSRVVVKCTPADLTKWRIPAPPNLAKLLCHIWGVPYDGIEPHYCEKPQHPEVAIQPGDGDARYKSIGDILKSNGKQ